MSRSERRTAVSANPRLPRWHGAGALVFLGTLVVATLLTWAHATRAHDEGLPVALEADLLTRVIAYDRNFQRRAGDVARFLIFVKPGNADSRRVALQMRSTLGLIGRVGGLPHEEIIVEYTTVKAFVETCAAKRAAVAYFGPGFYGDIPAIRTALEDHDILTVGSVPEYVPLGIVLGFDVVAGSPKLLLHLTQAKRQHVSLPAELLKIMRIFE